MIPSPAMEAAKRVEAVQSILGDSREVLRDFDDNSFDACVTDPPYALVSGGGANAVNKANRGQTASPYAARAGFMGMRWDNGDAAFDPSFWAEVLRVLKPGAHVLAFGGTRTYHRLAVAIEDAGFEIRDAVMWHYGSGFPKSLDVGKAIDKAAGAAREVIGQSQWFGRNPNGRKAKDDDRVYGVDTRTDEECNIVTAPATEAARQWEGWGTALKPATEIIVLARKPLSEPTVAANVLRWGTGALNIDGCRVGTTKDVPASPSRNGQWFASGQETGAESGHDPNIGRWPANLIHDGSDEVLAWLPETGAGGFPASRGAGGIANDGHRGQAGLESRTTDSGSAARFFYCAKADSDSRAGSKHPTVKPVDLMAYLVRLVTRKGGTVLDPFAGSGTTGEAALREGCKAVLIEREPAYFEDIKRRIALVLSGPEERQRAIVRARGDLQSADALPLFGGKA